MRKSALSYCANRAGVLRGVIRHAKSVANAQSTAGIEDAIEIAEDIVARLREQLPTPKPKAAPTDGHEQHE